MFVESSRFQLNLVSCTRKPTRKYIVAAALLLCIFSGGAHAEKSLIDSDYKSRYVVMATVTVKPEFFKKFVNETLPLIKKSRAENGVVIYQLHQSLDNPLKFVWYEHFEDKKFFDSHVDSDHVSKWAESLKDMASKQLVARPYKLIESRSDISQP